MRDDELLCEIEILENRVCRLETEKMDIMLANGKNKSKLKLKTDTIKKQNVKLKILQQQLDHQKAMWNKLKKFIVNRPYCAGYDVQEHGIKVITDIIDKMQELEQGEKDEV